MTEKGTVMLRNVSKIFPAQGDQAATLALDAVNLSVGPGEFISVVGPSGCGKTTLINVLAGFTPPTTGDVFVSGKSVTSPGPDRVVVFQDHAVFPWYTALENVAYGLKGRMADSRMASATAMEALGMVGLGDFAHAYPASLSGGMRQRVALARGLVMQPDVLLLDEPFAALDAISRSRLQDELIRLWERYRWTVIFVTHALLEAVYLSDRILLLEPPPKGLCLDKHVGAPRPRKRNDNSLLSLAELLEKYMDSSDL